jgi:threonine/homoserine/homoserine lactone efflux protein
MGAAIGQVLAFGVGVAISPAAIVAVILMLATPRGRSNGPAFLAGWLLGLAGAGTIVLLLSSGADATTAGAPADWVGVLKLVLGVLLLVVAVRRWRERPRGAQEAELPAWMRTIDRFTAARSAGFGILLSALNPKNLLLVVGAAAAIAQTGASTASQAVALAVFVVIGSLGTGTPVAIYLALGERSKRILDDLRGWMAHSNAVIIAVLCLVIGAKLIGDGISILSG